MRKWTMIIVQWYVSVPLPLGFRASDKVPEKETFPKIALHDISASLVKDEQSFQLSRNIIGIIGSARWLWQILHFSLHHQ